MNRFIGNLKISEQITTLVAFIVVAAGGWMVDVNGFDIKGRSSITFEYLSDADSYTVKSAVLPDTIKVASSKDIPGITRIVVSTKFDKFGFDANDLLLFAITKSQKRVPATKLLRQDEELANVKFVDCEIKADFAIAADQIEQLVIDKQQPNRCGATALELVKDDEHAKSASRWGKIFDCDEKCESIASFEKLSVTVPEGCYDLMPGNPLNAPFALNQVTGDFTFRVKVTGDFEPGKLLGGGRGNPYNGAGILVWEDERNFLRVERNAYWSGDGRMYTDEPLIEFWQDFKEMGLNSGVDRTDYFKGRSTWFQVQRRKAEIAVTISHDGKVWEDVKTFETELADEVFVGVLSINTSNKPFSVDFEDYSLATDRLMVGAEYSAVKRNAK